MPKLADLDRRPTKKIDLPSSTKDDPAWVEVYTEALTGDLEALGNVGDQKGLQIITGIKNMIKDWNFENPDGTKAEINIDNIRRMKQEDLVAILTQIDSYNDLLKLDPAKKKS